MGMILTVTDVDEEPTGRVGVDDLMARRRGRGGEGGARRRLPAMPARHAVPTSPRRSSQSQGHPTPDHGQGQGEVEREKPDPSGERAAARPVPSRPGVCCRFDAIRK